MMAQLVSILIPAYNASRWIGATIRSAIDQTWPNREIIVVNDGSTDNTLAIARQFESKIVKVISQENAGGCAARNKALEHSQGDYIQWLDADDLLAANKISLQMAAVERGLSDLTLVAGPYGKFYANPQRARAVPTSLWQDLSPIDWILRKFNENLFLIPACWLVSRRLTERAGRWDERLRLDQDGEYFCRVVAHSDGVKFLPEALSYYRQSGFQQKSRDLSDEALRSVLLSATLCIQYLRALEDTERTRRASLTLLQSAASCCYPDRTELLESVSSIGIELGGGLRPPKLRKRDAIVQKLFGVRRGRRIIRGFRRLRLATIVKWDELVSRVAGQALKVNSDRESTDRL